MSTRIPLDTVVEALDLTPDEMHSFLHRPTGKVLTVTDDALRAAEEEDPEGNRDGQIGAAVPAWAAEELEEAQKIITGGHDYLALPDRFEINEYRMLKAFSDSRSDPEERDALMHAVHGRGAFRCFKDTVHRLGLTEAWCAYREERYREVARHWCDANDIEYDETPARLA